jgi:ornithine carbamoyltransferase
MKKDFISFLDYTREELRELLDLAIEFREKWQSGVMPQALKGKAVALIWDAEGFRNRVAFELGIHAMGGISSQVPGKLDERESIEDVALYLGNWCNGIVARTRMHEHMLRLAEAAEIPVINGRTDFNHPCEILGDLAYVKSIKGHIEGIKVAFVGEATNLCHPWMEAAARLPIKTVQICPAGYEADQGFLDNIKLDAVGEVSVTGDLKHGLKDADIVYTDCWPGSENKEEYEEIKKLFLPYQITAERLALAKDDVFFLPCPPVTRGEEVSEDAMLSPSCLVFECKEYLLHAQNAVMMELFK